MSQELDHEAIDLARARVFVGSEQQRADLEELADVLAEEINVKEVEVVSEVGELVNYKLMPNNRVLGPKFGQNFPQVRQALLALDPAAAARTLQSGAPLTLQVAGETVTLSDEDVLVQTESRGRPVRCRRAGRAPVAAAH